MLVGIEKGFPGTREEKINLQNGLFVIVDPDWLETLNKYHWYAKKSSGLFYACSKVKIDGKVSFIRMHRLIANTPPELVCHHINHNALDNREKNLVNMTWFEHAKYYSWR